MILTGEVDKVQQMIEMLGKQIKIIIRQALEISYYSRGAWQYKDVLNMSSAERDMASEFINGRLEVAAKMPFPVF